MLDSPLPSLAALTIVGCSDVGLEGERLWLPQLTRLQLAAGIDTPVRCGAMPALAQLISHEPLHVTDSFAALQHLTYLDVPLLQSTHNMALASTMSSSLRSLYVEWDAPSDSESARQFAQALAAAASSQLTCLVRCCRVNVICFCGGPFGVDWFPRLLQPCPARWSQPCMRAMPATAGPGTPI